MIKYTEGNLLEDDADVLVNTVNTVGVMGKGIALMFKERFRANMKEYAKACKAGEVQTGKMFVTLPNELLGPKWIVNFPTKQHWRSKSKIDWIIEGLHDLKKFLLKENIKTIAIPPLGAGNGGLDWSKVKGEIENILAEVPTEIRVYEPTSTYQNIGKKVGVEKLTPARALVAEMIRRYAVLGMECSMIEAQKLAWFLQRHINLQKINNPLQLKFEANHYGPYADDLRHALEGLDGSYIKSEKRISDANPFEQIWFNNQKREKVAAYLSSEAKEYLPALEGTSRLIEGFETPFGMELLATLDWLIKEERCDKNVESLMDGIQTWKASSSAAERKVKIFDERVVGVALSRLLESELYRDEGLN